VVGLVCAASTFAFSAAAASVDEDPEEPEFVVDVVLPHALAAKPRMIQVAHFPRTVICHVLLTGKSL
jgi:hypothetical protein